MTEPKAPIAPTSGLVAANLGDPIRLSEVQLDGVAAESGRTGEALKVWTRLALTSDDPVFHRVAEGLAGVIRHRAVLVRAFVDLDRVKTILLVIRPDQTADLWLDTAATSINIMTKRAISAGKVVFERDIVDVIGMAFPAISIGKEDKVVCLFRQDWRFALYFDFNPDKNFNHDKFHRSLGSLYRSLKYRHIYDAIGRQDVFDRLVGAGWFPFAEIIHEEFPQLLRHCEANFDLHEVEENIIASFDAERLDRMLDRWLAKPHFASRAIVLGSAIRSFKANEPVAVIKTVLTEIEGVLNEAHRATHGKGAKIKALLKFAMESAERKAGDPQTLLLPNAFAAYLETRTYAHFDPMADAGDAGSRHAVGHGQAAPETYTRVAALQALLTLDQFAFCSKPTFSSRPTS